MGQLVNGKWEGRFFEVDSENGRFIRQDSVFRNWIRVDGSTRFQPDYGRYHLYVAHACPWAHRTLIFRKLKGLEGAISVSYVQPHMGNLGWSFNDDDLTSDTLHRKKFLYEIYTLARPDYTGRVTVPTLWDKHLDTIVSNESADIIRMLNTEFEDFSTNHTDYYPVTLRREIDEINDLVYENVNNGVYRTGFATTQEAYGESVLSVFHTLDKLEDMLGKRRYLAGAELTEADWRLFPTLVRFDPVYHYHFKCNLKKIADYPNLSNYLRELYQYPGIAETFNLELTKQHYYQSHENINPTRIVPLGPEIDLTAAHDRERL